VTRGSQQAGKWEAPKIFLTDHIALILIYRRTSLRDIRKMYPAKIKPAAPTTFRAILNVFIVLPSTSFIV
jgi:hypothetical protein